MSSISSIAGGGLSGFLKNITGGHKHHHHGIGHAAAGLASLIEGTSNAASTGTSTTSTTGPVASLFSKIESTVSAALQSTSASDDAADANAVVKTAIESTLNDAADGAGINSTTSPTAGGNSGNTTTPATGALGNASPATSSHAQFMQVLQAHGIDAAQYQADFQAAVKSVRDGGVNVARIFAGATGSLLNVQA